MAMAIATSKIDDVSFQGQCSQPKTATPEFRGAAVDDSLNDFAMFSRYSGAELLDICRSIVAKDVSDLIHCAPPALGRS